MQLIEAGFEMFPILFGFFKASGIITSFSGATVFIPNDFSLNMRCIMNLRKQNEDLSSTRRLLLVNYPFRDYKRDILQQQQQPRLLWIINV